MSADLNIVGSFCSVPNSLFNEMMKVPWLFHLSQCLVRMNADLKIIRLFFLKVSLNTAIRIRNS